MLLFKKKFLEAIRAGTKTQTIRIWPVCRMKDGQRSYIPGAGYIQLDALETLTLDQLTADDASRDGFSSLAELLAEIDRLYPHGELAGHKVYRLRYHLLPPEEQEEVARAQKLRKQAKKGN